ncbi:MAG: hypothetical protein AB7P03_28905 [Kofleriaceae bacterium]
MSCARILVFALALTHSVGLADLVLDDACDQVCSDDGCGADCLPDEACRCHCPSATPMLGGSACAVAKLDAPPVRIVPTHIQREHASPDPREILHVPRLLV